MGSDRWNGPNIGRRGERQINRPTLPREGNRVSDGVIYCCLRSVINQKTELSEKIEFIFKSRIFYRIKYKFEFELQFNR